MPRTTRNSTMTPNSSPASCRRRLYEKDVPKEVHIQENSESPSKRGREDDENEGGGSPKKTTRGGSHIQPGLAEEIPEPPKTDPPTLMELVPLAFVGPAKAGKTSLLRSFVQRQYVTSPPTFVEDVPLPVDYFKKDFSFNDVNNNVCCVRMQCYDVNRGGPHAKFLKNQKKEWQRLMSKMQQIVLVISLGDSNLLDTVTEWKEWLDKTLQDQEEQPPITSLLLTRSDAVQGLGPVDWMRLGASISEACRLLKFSRWYISSACLDHSYESIDVVMRSLAEDALYHRSQRKKGDPTVSPATGNCVETVPATPATAATTPDTK